MEPEKKDGKSNVGLLDKVREQIPSVRDVLVHIEPRR